MIADHSNAPEITVFISYSHVDEAWKNKLLPHLCALATAGIDMQVWHDRKIDGGDKWYPEIEEAMANATAAVLLISSDFLGSDFCIKEEVPALLQRQEHQGMLLIPVLLRACPWKAHRWLSDRQMIPRDGKCVAIDFPGDHADTVFSAVAEQVCAHLEQLSSQPALPVAVPWPELPAGRIDRTRLPETGSSLFGRDDELARLDQAWAGDAPLRILAFTAHGGVGKSTLVNHWLAEMARQNYRGASHVFAWSFYSQGVREQTAASADSFINAALRFFGDADPAAGSPWDKGSRLAHLVGSQHALLVLDGLEPLQSPYTFERGKLRDPAMESLLRGLARQSNGLCLITTREPVTDLANKPGVVLHDLEQITPQAGRALLRTARVVATDAQLQDLAGRFGPHALAVSLLGVYLYEQPGHGIAPAEQLEQMPGAQPIDRVLAGFDQWLGDGPERDVLRLLGLFDRPADAGCLGALREAPIIAGLTDHLVVLDDAAWGRVLARLEKLRLIHVQTDGGGAASVDAHPLLREYFAVQLREKQPEVWRAGHRRLYEHLYASTKESESPSLEDLQPLYQAVAHGCQAGLQQQARAKVYRDRILRGREAYSTKKLGAYASDLGAVACFFDVPWSSVSPALSEDDHAWLLSEAAYSLRALGWLSEALEPMHAGLAMRVKQQNWASAAICASNVSQLALTLGEVAGARHDAELSVSYADRSGDAFQRLSKRATHADALHQAGRRAEAQDRFGEAERLQAERQPAYPLLYSLQGFRYCDLLLAAAERAAWQHVLRPDASHQRTELVQACHAVTERAAQTLHWVTEQGWLLDIALDHLTLGRAAFYEVALGLPPPNVAGSQVSRDLINTAATQLDAAVDGLRSAGAQHYLPLGLLSRAWLRTLTGRRTGPDSAQTDLDEAWEIAERGPMPLFLADIHLHRARLFGSEAKYPWCHHLDGTRRGPAADLAEARRLIVKHGYLRRMEELQDAELALNAAA